MAYPLGLGTHDPPLNNSVALEISNHTHTTDRTHVTDSPSQSDRTHVTDSPSQHSTKYKLKFALFVFNMITFIVSTTSLCLSFNEVTSQCVVLVCDLSAPDAASSLCEYGRYGVGSCNDQREIDPNHKFSLNEATCNDMIQYYGCNCVALDQCEGMENKYDYEEYNRLQSDCEAYTCSDYCYKLCWNIKYTAFIMLVICETLMAIPTFEADRMLCIGECKWCVCCCCGFWNKTERRQDICTSITQYLTTWMLNVSVYIFEGPFFGVAHLDWIWIIGLLFVIIGYTNVFVKEKKEGRCCKTKNVCNYSEYMKVNIIPLWGACFAFFFIIACWVRLLNDWTALEFTFKALFDFDFEMKFYTGIHTIALLTSQFLSTVRRLFECNIINL